MECIISLGSSNAFMRTYYPCLWWFPVKRKYICPSTNGIFIWPNYYVILKTSETLASDCNWNLKELVVTICHKWQVLHLNNLSETIVMLWHLGIMNYGRLYICKTRFLDIIWSVICYIWPNQITKTPWGPAAECHSAAASYMTQNPRHLVPLVTTVKI